MTHAILYETVSDHERAGNFCEKAFISQSYVTATRQATNHAAANESRLSHHTYRINNASTNIIKSSNRSSAENISDLGLIARHQAEVEHRRIQNSKHFTQEGFSQIDVIESAIFVAPI